MKNIVMGIGAVGAGATASAVGMGALMAEKRSDLARKQQECREGARRIGQADDAPYLCTNPYSLERGERAVVPHQGRAGKAYSLEPVPLGVIFLSAGAAFTAGALGGKGKTVQNMIALGSAGAFMGAMGSYPVAEKMSGVRWGPSSDSFLEPVR